MSSLLYHAIRNALKLEEPAWTTDGEILNVDRFVFLPAPQNDFGRKFTLKPNQPRAFNRMIQFLDQIIQPSGFMYKDVVQPFVTAHWLSEHRFPTLTVKRPLADVVYSMTARQWNYPAKIISDVQDKRLSLAIGLAQATEALNSVLAQTIHFDDFIWSEEIVAGALHALYPKRTIGCVRYIDSEFKRHRDEILARRKSRRYKAILRLLASGVVRRGDQKSPGRRINLIC
jgi:hypothetical protein